jgi:hypothetical protein
VLCLSKVRSSFDNAHLVVAPGCPFRANSGHDEAVRSSHELPVSDIDPLLGTGQNWLPKAATVAPPIDRLNHWRTPALLLFWLNLEEVVGVRKKEASKESSREAAVAPENLEGEIEIFRRDEEAAQQFLFAYLGIRAITSQRPDVLAAVNRTAMFWITSRESLLISTFIWLGRVFDQRSSHNVDRLLKIVERNLPALNRDVLRKRKEKYITPQQAAEYVQHKHETTTDDVRSLKKQVAAWRKIYEPIYQPIRHHFAHNKITDPADLAALMSKTNIDEMKRMFGFLHALHEGLAELYLNGRRPLPLPDVTFVLPPKPEPQRQYYPGEKAYREAQAALLSLLP